MTFQIITDATADLPDEFILEHQLLVLDMIITIDGKAYSTSGKGKLTSEALLSELAAGKKAVTSAVGTGEAQEAFKKFIENGTEVLYLAFSSGLSGTFQSATIARDLVLEEYSEAKLTVIDSLAAASGEAYLLEEVVKLRDAGKTVAETVTALNDLIPRLKSWFMVDDLNFLARGGRISKTAALVGTMASIKPVLDVDSTGHLRQVSKVRGSKKAIKALIDNTLEDFDENYPRIMIAYSGTAEAAKSAKEEFLKNLSNVQIDIRPLGPVISAHTGSGTLAIFSIGKKLRL